jgi:hypothetical protein
MKYLVEVILKNNKVIRSRALGFEHATEAQQRAYVAIKPILNTWIRGRLSQFEDFKDASVLVRCKHTESSNSLNIDFKVQSVEQENYSSMA